MAKIFKIKKPPNKPSFLSPFKIKFECYSQMTLPEIKEKANREYDEEIGYDADLSKNVSRPNKYEHYSFEFADEYADVHVQLEWSEEHYDSVIMADYQAEVNNYERWKEENKDSIEAEMKRRKEFRNKKLSKERESLIKRLNDIEVELNDD